MAGRRRDRRAPLLDLVVLAGVPPVVAGLALRSGHAALYKAAERFIATWCPGYAWTKTLVLVTLPPARLAARLASCAACWLASRPCACPPPRRHECAVCQADEGEGEGGEAGSSWTALACGHLFHRTCILAWAASSTHAARQLAALPSHTEAVCPLDRSVITRVASKWRSAAQKEEEVPVVDGLWEG